MPSIKISEKVSIGENRPVFIIAEAGVNHNGKLSLAKKLIDAAKAADADAVKFQTFKAEKLVTASAKQAEYQKKNMGKTVTQFEMLKQLELSKSDFRSLKDYSDKKGIIFLSTPFDIESADFLNSLKVPLFKISSGDLTNLPFLKQIAGFKKPLILSTGMSGLKEVSEAVHEILDINKKLVLLHCVSNYPCRYEDINLRSIQTLRDKFKLITGYSDHSQGINIPIAAAALGAAVIEKHFTLDTSLPGPDHKASITPEQLKKMVEGIRQVEQALGTGKKMPVKSEEEVKKLVRKSIIAVRDLNTGEKITSDDLEIKRPGTGIEPKYINKVLGSIVKKKIKSGEPVQWSNLKK
ncbi:MAG: N-acetylneuraminate synthase [bacterium]|nr:N-acetylneuraminate synthase [bacterium]